MTLPYHLLHQVNIVYGEITDEKRLENSKKSLRAPKGVSQAFA